jgi:hypothetical protein
MSLKPLIIFAALSSCTPAPAITNQEIEKLIPALEKVESGGKANAIGDNGKAVGVLQVWPVMVNDVNRIRSGKAYTLADRYSPTKSREMARIYFRHYGKSWTIEQAARCWNGGTQGYKKQSTVKYWNKVRKEI